MPSNEDDSVFREDLMSWVESSYMARKGVAKGRVAVLVCDGMIGHRRLQEALFHILTRSRIVHVQAGDVGSNDVSNFPQPNLPRVARGCQYL